MKIAQVQRLGTWRRRIVPAAAIVGVVGAAASFLAVATMSRNNPNASAAPSVKTIAPQPDSNAASVWYRRKVVKEGIAVEFSMQALDSRQRSEKRFRRGDNVRFRLRITDTATGAPVTRVYPALWMDFADDSGGPPTSCTKKAEALIGGSLFAQAELDLNAYYVLALNHDATISVVDPHFSFGGSQLLSFVVLESPGEDWALSRDQSLLYVSLPSSDTIAVVGTASWEVLDNIDVARRPTRVALHPNDSSLWVSCAEDGDDSCVVVIDTETRSIAGQVAGAGFHECAFSHDGRYAFITNSAGGKVSVVSAADPKIIEAVDVGANPASIAYSSRAASSYVCDHHDGTVTAIDGSTFRPTVVANTKPGLTQLRFAPGGRWAFVVNSKRDEVHILDAACNQIVQTATVDQHPDAVAFSDDLAYVHHRNSANVLMIPLNQVGVKGRRVPVVEFPGGNHAPQKGAPRSPASPIVQAPGANAVLVSNPLDEAVYFYKEGMAAPMGSFSNYRKQPRAVQVVDRSLRERRSPGVYETVARLRRPGNYDAVFFLDAPRIIHCFQVMVDEDPEFVARTSAGKVDVEPLLRVQSAAVGETVEVRFRIVDRSSKTPRSGVTGVYAKVMLAPGGWHDQVLATPDAVARGVYTIRFNPPREGVYYVYPACPSLGVDVNNPGFAVWHVARNPQGDASKPDCDDSKNGNSATQSE